MALIIDPDQLNQNTELTFDTTNKTIQLSVAGNLSNDGVTLQALYSFCKEEWKTDSALIKHPFPFVPITNEAFEIIEGWDFKDATTKNLIRTGGWSRVDTNGVTQEMYAGIVTLGSLETGTQVYFAQSAGTPTDVELTGAVNQAVLIYTNGGTDDRADLTLFARKQGDKFAQSTLSDIGVTTMGAQVYRFPLATSADLKITLGDTTINTSPYNGITITYHSSPIARTIGGVSYNFNVEVDGNGQSAQAIYERLQYELRLNSDIDDGSGTITGKTADELAFFLGDTLKMREGVFLTNFNPTATNNILHDPIGASFDIAFPFTASLQIQFGTNLQNDNAAVYRVFFTNDDSGDNTGRDFGTSTAITVQDDTSTDMSGSVGGASSVTLAFDYDGNTQRGNASAGQDAEITVVGLGLETGQYVAAEGTISRSTSNVVTLVSSLERNYQNN